MSNQQRNQAFKQIHVSTVTALPCHPHRDARPERSCPQIYKMGTGLYQRTETISIGFAKIAANRRVTGRLPAQLAVLDDADAAAPCDHPPDRRQHERHAAVCAGPVQRLAAEASYFDTPRKPYRALCGVSFFCIRRFAAKILPCTAFF